MAGLPLALATAGAFLRKNTLSFQQYLEVYKQRWKVDRRRPSRLQEYPDRTLYTTWNLTYNQLKDDDSEAAQMLVLLAYFDHQAIWYELFQAGLQKDPPAWLPTSLTDRTDFESMMGTLVDYCLIEVQHADESKSTYGIHSCVHDWTLGALRTKVDAKRYWYAFDCVAASISHDPTKSLEVVEYARITPHAVRLIHQRLEAVGKEIADVRLNKADLIACLLHRQDQLEAASTMFQRVLDRKEQVLGRDHVSTLRTTNNFGTLFYHQNRLHEAEQMYNRVLATQDEAFKADHETFLRVVNNLGIVYRDQDKYDEAERMLRRALEIEKILGPDHSLTLGIVENLGGVYKDQCKLDEAKQLFSRVLAGNEKALGPDHTATLTTIHNLGILELAYGRLVEAEQLLLRALAGREKVSGLSHATTLRTVYHLGAVYDKQGKLGTAEQMFDRVVAGMDKAFGPGTSLTLSTFAALADIHTANGRLDEAERLLTRALAGRERSRGLSHSKTLETVHQLGRLYLCQGAFDKAEQMLIRELAGREQTLGPDHASIRHPLDILSQLYIHLGELPTGWPSQCTLQGLRYFSGHDVSATASTKPGGRTPEPKTLPVGLEKPRSGHQTSIVDRDTEPTSGQTSRQSLSPDQDDGKTDEVPHDGSIVTTIGANLVARPHVSKEYSRSWEQSQRQRFSSDYTNIHGFICSGRLYVMPGHDKVEKATRADQSKPYIELSVPDEFTQIERIVITTESHDQGWSDLKRALRGKYDNSNTWFDIFIQYNREPGCPTVRDCFQYNLNSWPTYQTHTNLFHVDDSNTTRADWVRRLRAGDTIRVYARAQYHGWINYVKYCKITLDGKTTCLETPTPAEPLMSEPVD